MEKKTKRLMAILAHPDDESLGMGGAMIKYAEEGVETFLVTATRGERGRFGTAQESPGIAIVGKTREGELRKAAEKLKIKELSFLDYLDGDLDKAEPQAIISKIAMHICRVRPQVVITFGPEGGYGHPDHIAISQFTTAAVVYAANPNGQGEYPPYAVQKLYYMEWGPSKWEAYQSAFKSLASQVDGKKRIATPFPDWAITTRIDAVSHWKKVWEAITCHETQMAQYGSLAHLPESLHEELWGRQEFYRVFSLVNGGRAQETDLFEGIN